MIKIIVFEADTGTMLIEEELDIISENNVDVIGLVADLENVIEKYKED